MSHLANWRMAFLIIDSVLWRRFFNMYLPIACTTMIACCEFTPDLIRCTLQLPVRCSAKPHPLILLLLEKDGASLLIQAL
jgi:hypothetical protein